MGFYKELRTKKYAREDHLVESLISQNDWINDLQISKDAAAIVSNCRKDRNKTRLDNFFLEYGLSNQEGVALMCLAESLLRIPDNRTCDDIINEKIGVEIFNILKINKNNELLLNLSRNFHST